jgi:glycosyltransferase involved in cell wall biosynthesis
MKPDLIEMPIRALHITASIGRESFGLGQVAVNLAKAQNDLNADAQIWCLDTDDQIDWAITLPGLERSRVTAFPRLGPSKLESSPAMLSAAKSDGADFNIVHQHGIWTACSQVASTLRKVHGVSTVIAPHGSLQKWALRRSPWKKRLALLAYERENLQRAACIHALTEAEVSDFRDYGLVNPIAVIPNGISEAWLVSQGEGSRFREQHSIPADRRILLFLSRIAPVKGLPLLLEAVDQIRSDFVNWLLVIAGTDEFGHLREVESLVAKLDLLNFVKLTGPLYDQDKRDAFAASDAFVLPSYGEGAPMVVLESLATGVPVITTMGTPWQSLVDWSAGWWVDASAEGIVQALQDMLSLSRSQLKVMGRHGLNLVRSQYLWKAQAQKALDLYAWLLGRQAKPDFVITD